MIYTEREQYPVTGAYSTPNGKEITFTAMYIGDLLFWQGKRSCYGLGIWRPAKPWLDNEKWKDNRR